MVRKEDVKEGDYFLLSKDKGYSDSQRREPMQIMEARSGSMTVQSCKNGCITKPYDWFDKVENPEDYPIKHSCLGFEDKR